MPQSEYLAGNLLKLLFGNTSYSIPADIYVGLGIAPTWAASTGYANGAYVVGSAFGSSNRHIFKATSAGTQTSGTTEPTWVTTAGGTTTDNAVTWTECTNLFDGSTLTGLEATGGSYARVTVANNTTNWGNYSAGPPAQIQNITAINFVTPTSSGWGQAVAALLFDASTSGNLLAWALLSAGVTCGAGSSPAFAANALTFTLT